MIIGFFGNVRQGKTYSAIIELWKLYNAGYTIYSNTWLSFPYIPLTMDFMLDIVEQDLDLPYKCCFFIDELTIFADSRMSSSKRSRIFSYMILQSGKLSGTEKGTKNYGDYGLILLYTAQFPHLIDKRVRSTTDIATECEKIEFNGKKYFKQTINVFRGSKSFTYVKVVAGTSFYYDLYDTRKKIKVEVKDRYKDGM